MRRQVIRIMQFERQEDLVGGGHGWYCFCGNARWSHLWTVNRAQGYARNHVRASHNKEKVEEWFDD